MPTAAAALDRNAHQRFHVAMIKRVHGVLIAIKHAGFKFSDRVRRALRVGVIGREYEQLGADVIDDPPDRFAGKRRKSQVLLNGLGRRSCKLPLVLVVGSGKVEGMQPLWYPKSGMFHRYPPQVGVAFEYFVKDHGREKYLHAVFDGNHPNFTNGCVTTEL